MREIFTSYDVEMAYSLSDLHQQCEHAASMGWEFIGGVSVCYNPIENRMQYFQAVGLRSRKVEMGEIDFSPAKKEPTLKLPSFEDFMRGRGSLRYNGK